MGYTIKKLPTLHIDLKLLGRNIVFQVIAPSLPGFGFSEGASKPGLNSAEMGQILNTLMKRLGFEQYYLQGGELHVFYHLRRKVIN